MDKQEFHELKSKFEKETRKKKYIGSILNYASTAVAGLALSLLISKFFTSDYLVEQPRTQTTIIETKSFEAQIISLKNELKKSKRYADSLYKLKNIEPINIPNPKLIELENKISELDKLIIDNPEKAISIPVLKIEIQHLKEQNEKDVKSMREEIARSYDTNKWIVGLVCTMLISIIALNISNLLAKSKKD